MCINFNMITFLYYNRGTLKFADVMKAGTTKRRREIKDLQSRLQFDDPINVQFTSVNIL
jgi:hypothetical protein